MAQLFPASANTVMRWGLLAAALTPFVLIGWTYAVMKSPYVTGEDRILDQPVPFSHAHHVGGLGLDCRYCHTSVEVSAFAGMPPTETCMTCHSQLWTQAEMLAPVRNSLATGIPLRWKRVHDLPDYVYFDHSVHVANGVGCTSCHGPVDEMPLMRQAAPLTMGWCLDCHRNPAKALRPQDEIFATDWRPPGNQAGRGQVLLERYHIEVDHLTDCSVCHR